MISQPSISLISLLISLTCSVVHSPTMVSASSLKLRRPVSSPRFDVSQTRHIAVSDRNASAEGKPSNKLEYENDDGKESEEDTELFRKANEKAEDSKTLKTFSCNWFMNLLINAETGVSLFILSTIIAPYLKSNIIEGYFGFGPPKAQKDPYLIKVLDDIVQEVDQLKPFTNQPTSLTAAYSLMILFCSIPVFFVLYIVGRFVIRRIRKIDTKRRIKRRQLRQKIENAKLERMKLLMDLSTEESQTSSKLAERPSDAQ